jgi:hypothetical protein
VASDDDDAQVLAKMAALDAEVKADLARQRARKEKVMELIAAKKAAAGIGPAADTPAAPPAPAPATVAKQLPDKAPAPAAPPKPAASNLPAKKAAARIPDPTDEDLMDLLNEVAPPPAKNKPEKNKLEKKAPKPSKVQLDNDSDDRDQKVDNKRQLQKTPKKKSLKIGGLVSVALGPIGWLYAGSWRESVPAAALFLGVGYLLQFLPTIILWPALTIGLPISGIMGAIYASRYNKTGRRQRLFGENTSQPKLSTGKK